MQVALTGLALQPLGRVLGRLAGRGGGGGGTGAQDLILESDFVALGVDTAAWVGRVPGFGADDQQGGAGDPVFAAGVVIGDGRVVGVEGLEEGRAVGGDIGGRGGKDSQRDGRKQLTFESDCVEKLWYYVR